MERTIAVSEDNAAADETVDAGCFEGRFNKVLPKPPDAVNNDRTSFEAIWKSVDKKTL